MFVRVRFSADTTLANQVACSSCRRFNFTCSLAWAEDSLELMCGSTAFVAKVAAPIVLAPAVASEAAKPAKSAMLTMITSRVLAIVTGTQAPAALCLACCQRALQHQLAAQPSAGSMMQKRSSRHGMTQMTCAISGARHVLDALSSRSPVVAYAAFHHDDTPC